MGDVTTTLKAQISVTIKHQQRWTSENQWNTLSDVSSSTKYFMTTSAMELPPAFAVCEGQNNLFKKLHAFHLRVVWTITANTHRYFLDSTTCTLAVTRATKSAKQRTSDLINSAKFRKLWLFTHGSDQQIEGLKGQIRQGTCPFLWVCAMGMTYAAEDEYPLVQICLLVNEIIIKLSVINMPYNQTLKTTPEIDKLQ